MNINKEFTVSVVLASYNGGKYIEKQIDSILCQLKPDDELIVSDDGSTDETLTVVKSFSSNNIKVVDGPHRGYIENFESLIAKAEGDIIVISDQDDVWEKNKLEKIRKAFSDNRDTWVVLHNADYIDQYGTRCGQSIFFDRNAKHGYLKNLMKSSYYGCCMAISREYKYIIIPFPLKILSYDQWIGLFAEKHNKSVFIDECLIHHRIHGTNQTQKRNLLYRIRFRSVLLKYMYLLEKRLKTRSNSR